MDRKVFLVVPSCHILSSGIQEIALPWGYSKIFVFSFQGVKHGEVMKLMHSVHHGFHVPPLHIDSFASFLEKGENKSQEGRETAEMHSAKEITPS